MLRNLASYIDCELVVFSLWQRHVHMSSPECEMVCESCIASIWIGEFINQAQYLVEYHLIFNRVEVPTSSTNHVLPVVLPIVFIVEGARDQ